MAVFGIKSRVTHVWLMALLTLFAGLPPVQCRCPSGRIKPFCLSSVFGTSTLSCCCAERVPDSEEPCCGAPVATPTEQAERPCCPHCRPQPTADTLQSASVSRLCCVKSLGQFRNLALTPSETRSSPDRVCVAALSSHGPSPCFSFSGHGSDTSQVHLPEPPPADLVTIFQHFLI